MVIWSKETDDACDCRSTRMTNGTAKTHPAIQGHARRSLHARVGIRMGVLGGVM